MLRKMAGIIAMTIGLCGFVSTSAMSLQDRTVVLGNLIKATYCVKGNAAQCIDVTDIIQKHIREKGSLFIEGQWWGMSKIFTDPFPNKLKELVIEYEEYVDDNAPGWGRDAHRIKRFDDGIAVRIIKMFERNN